MKILFIVPSYKPAFVYGGTIVVIARLAEQLALEGHDVSVYTTTANGKAELDVVPGKEMIIDGVRVTYFKRITGDHTHVSSDLWRCLYNNIKSFDVVHIHSWWSPLIIGAFCVCRIKKVKPVFSPHGMLSKYIIETNNPRKKKAVHIMGKRLLKHATLHVTADTEWEESLNIIPHWRGHVIPNLVALSNIAYQRTYNDVFTIGFISRIDPKKGLDLLITALSNVTFDYKLQIAGDGDPDYIASLKRLAEEKGNASKLHWVGWKNGEDKFKFLAQLDLFALTSYNENFAVVAIEALSVGTPVLVSDKVGLYKYVLERDMGWITDLNVNNITQKLNTLFSDSTKQRRINAEAPSKIKIDFDDSALAKEYIQLYQNK
ncbi:glycosyltransferase [Pedobacter sp. MC2016-15]|uniref:XrtY-associated glycosyltransferase XYAG1 n=1 Tax=Pedobacter sp. MC2016-15 TaxID=2994473 RepID=UPI00224783BD|nr:glycosyltransferase [Pedobacter sp. MC2016-15]MCX2481787.1 glycosyltransferase [Pedobacter sp. MC2016-15]